METTYYYTVKINWDYEIEDGNYSYGSETKEFTSFASARDYLLANIDGVHLGHLHTNDPIAKYYDDEEDNIIMYEGE
jgi:hypothetical protein